MKNDAPLAQARAAHRLVTDASAAIEGLVNTLSTGIQCPVKADVNAAHRRAHRMGRPAKIAADSELQAFVTARLDTLTFDQIAREIAANFPPARRASRSSIHRWWQKTRTN
jgi:hypothetical protein